MYTIFETNLLTLFTMSVRNLARIFNKVFFDQNCHTTKHHCSSCKNNRSFSVTLILMVHKTIYKNIKL